MIVSDVGAASENVVPHTAGDISTGWVVPTADANALADRLAKALTLSPQALADMGRRARGHALEKFALYDMQRATLSTYDELLGTELAAAFAQSKRL